MISDTGRGLAAENLWPNPKSSNSTQQHYSRDSLRCSWRLTEASALHNKTIIVLYTKRRAAVADSSLQEAVTPRFKRPQLLPVFHNGN